MFRVLQPSVQEPVEFKKTVNKYGYYLDDEKKRVFGVIGSVDFVELINSHLAQCDYSQIMASLMPSSAEFSDFEDVLALEEKISDPNDGLYYMSLLQDEFQKLPLEVKERYGKDFSIFARDFIGGGFANFISEKYGVDKGLESDIDSVVETSATVGSAPGFDREFKELTRRIDELQKQTIGTQQSNSQSVGGEEK